MVVDGEAKHENSCRRYVGTRNGPQFSNYPIYATFNNANKLTLKVYYDDKDRAISFKCLTLNTRLGNRKQSTAYQKKEINCNERDLESISRVYLVRMRRLEDKAANDFLQAFQSVLFFFSSYPFVFTWRQAGNKGSHMIFLSGAILLATKEASSFSVTIRYDSRKIFSSLLVPPTYRRTSS